MSKTETEIKEIKIEKLVASKTNPRKNFDESELKDLALSIGEKGIIQPLIVRAVNGSFEIIAGERRFKASKIAKLKSVPCVVKKVDDQEALEIQIIENLQREDLNAMEEANSFNYLMTKKKIRLEDLAIAVGKSKAFVNARLRLLLLPEKLQKLLLSEELPISWAVEIQKVTDKEALKDIAQKVMNGRFNNLSEIKEVVSDRLLFLKDAPFSIKDIRGDGKPVCLQCTNNTSLQKDLFEGIGSKAMCLNSKCWNEKKKAALNERIKEYTSKGEQVFRGKQAEEVTSYKSEWVDINDWNSAGENGRYGELLKGTTDAIKFAYYVDQLGNLCKIVNKKQAEKIIRAKVSIEKRKSAGVPEKKSEAEILKARKERKAKKLKTVASEESIKLGVATIQKASASADINAQDLLRIIVLGFLNEHGYTKKVVEHLGLKKLLTSYGAEDTTLTLEKYLKSANTPQLKELVILFAMNNVTDYTEFPEPTETLSLLMTFFKYDHKAKVKELIPVVEKRMDDDLLVKRLARAKEKAAKEVPVQKKSKSKKK